MRDAGDTNATAATTRREKLPAKVWGVMALTTTLTFATLTTGYEIFFARQVVADVVAADLRS